MVLGGKYHEREGCCSICDSTRTWEQGRLAGWNRTPSCRADQLSERSRRDLEVTKQLRDMRIELKQIRDATMANREEDGHQSTR